MNAVSLQVLPLVTINWYMPVVFTAAGLLTAAPFIDHSAVNPVVLYSNERLAVLPEQTFTDLSVPRSSSTIKVSVNNAVSEQPAGLDAISLYIPPVVIESGLVIGVPLRLHIAVSPVTSYKPV